ncbi:cytochrome P450 [Pisolithus sp. B1]|nr:cytochrome P450 [Pisolithus sp. B1]
MIYRSSHYFRYDEYFPFLFINSSLAPPFDHIPILTHVPEWFPGIDFESGARDWHTDLQNMIDQSLEFVKSQIAAGVASKSFTSDLLERKMSTEEEQDIKWTTGIMFAGGVGTTVSSNYAFFLAMTLYPDVQKEAQEEIDAVVGSDRLPAFVDRFAHDFIVNITDFSVVTVLRRVIANDIHNGYYISKGTLVISNVWGMPHDPSTYSDPMEFSPDRFLPGEGESPPTDSRNICFGFGRCIVSGSSVQFNEG